MTNVATNKNEKDKKLLLESYLHWITDGLLPLVKQYNRGNIGTLLDLTNVLSGQRCPLCIEYGLNACYGCPISEYSGNSCNGTVFYELRSMTEYVPGIYGVRVMYSISVEKKTILSVWEMCLFLKKLFFERAEYAASKNLKNAVLDLNLSTLEPWLREAVIQDCMPFMDFSGELLKNGIHLVYDEAKILYESFCKYESGEKTIKNHLKKFLKNTDFLKHQTKGA